MVQQQLFDTNGEEIESLLPKDGAVSVYFNFFNAEESRHYFQCLMETISWKQDEMQIHGKTVKLPRLTAWYGETGKDYSYSGINQATKPWTKELLEIKERVERKSGIGFTNVLLNLYRNGNDSVSWHRDNERVLRVNPVIGSVSFGAARMFKFRHINDHSLIRSVLLTPGTFVLMQGETQHYWEHHIPKSKKVTEPRINLTFRILY